MTAIYWQQHLAAWSGVPAYALAIISVLVGGAACLLTYREVGAQRLAHILSLAAFALLLAPLASVWVLKIILGVCLTMAAPKAVFVRLTKSTPSRRSPTSPVRATHLASVPRMAAATAIALSRTRSVSLFGSTPPASTPADDEAGEDDPPSPWRIYDDFPRVLRAPAASKLRLGGPLPTKHPTTPTHPRAVLVRGASACRRGSDDVHPTGEHHVRSHL